MEYEEFWELDNFLIVTDGTKPALKWTANELRKRGKIFTVLDCSENPMDGSIQNISQAPDSISNVVIGITKKEPGEIIRKMTEKGVQNFWVHWKTDTSEVKDIKNDNTLNVITGRCPMMYLGSSASIHGFHRFVAKTIGKY